MTCRRCGLAAPRDAWVCPACGTRLASPVIESAAVLGRILEGATATARGLRFGVVALAGSGLLLFAWLTLAALALAVPSPLALLVSAVAAALPVPLYTLAILWLDRHEREPSWLLALAFLWGALVATGLAMVFTTTLELLLRAWIGADRAVWFAAPVLAPLVEETAKGAALLVIARRFGNEFDNAVDGVVYGGLIGLGFAMTENVLYLGRAFLAGGLPVVGVLFLIRVVASGFAHSMFTGMAGAGLGLARERRGPGRAAIAVAGYLVALALHGLWNLVATLGAMHRLGLAALVVDVAVLLLPGVWTLLAIVHFGWRRERQAIALELAPEVETRVVRAEEVATLTDRRARRRALWAALTARGPLAWYALRQLYDQEIELAFRKWRTARGETSGRDAVSLAELRARIGRLRAQLAGPGAAAAARAQNP